MSTSRRKFIQQTTLATAGVAVMNSPLNVFARDNANQKSAIRNQESFSLAPLPFAFDALEPFIDSQTMNIHWDKHHRGYVDKLNAALDKEPDYKTKTLEELLANTDSLPDTIKTAVRNNGGGHWNHTFFWRCLTAEKNMPMQTNITNAIILKWKTIEAFQNEFEKAGKSLFGSGWVWLLKDKVGVLSIVTTPNQDNTLMDISETKGTPVFAIDVWEHAYYLKHQNIRADYLKAIWNVVNWKKVEELYLA